MCIIFTATPLSSALNPEAEFAYGAGQINPIEAVNPGLVYDISEHDYVKFLCGEGYDTIMLKIITDVLITCTEDQIIASDLNLPSFALSTELSKNIIKVIHRTVATCKCWISKFHLQSQSDSATFVGY